MDINAPADFWPEYYSGISNNINAYAEFKYWTLKYMTYARANDKNTYDAIINNKEYCRAYAESEKRYAALIDKTYKKLPELNKKLASKDLEFIVNGTKINLRQGRGTWGGSMMDDYAKLMKEMQKKEYIDMDAAIKAAAK